MATDIGLNFRASSGYVTDGAGETYVLETDGYPTTRGGATFGWETGAVDDRDRNSGVDRRLAGIHFLPGSSPAEFRLDLDATGDHDVECAFGDYSSAQRHDASIKDGTTEFIRLGVDVGVDDGTSSQEWFDATVTLRTSASDWTSNQTAVSRTFTNTICRVELRDPSASVTAISHLRVVAAGGGGGVTIALLSATLGISAPSTALTQAYAFTAGADATAGQALTLGQGVGLGAGSDATSGRPVGLAQRFDMGAGSDSTAGQALSVLYGFVYAIGAGVVNIVGLALDATGAAAGAVRRGLFRMRRWLNPF